MAHVTTLPFDIRRTGFASLFGLSFLTLVSLWMLPTPAQAESPPVVNPPVVQSLSAITIETEKGPQTFIIELAVTPEETARGLMFRKSMEQRHGMLFQFESNRTVQMWMKNTFIPLDMIFFDETGRISHIHKGAVPQSLDVISSNGPARFVLEVNAGEADMFGLKTGQTASHPWFPATN